MDSGEWRMGEEGEECDRCQCRCVRGAALSGRYSDYRMVGEKKAYVTWCPTYYPS